MDIKVRSIKRKEIMLLTEFLYEAIYQKNNENLLPRTVIQESHLWTYIDDFGSKKDDHCLVAEVDGFIVGAVWVRCIHGFAYINDSIPEFSISVYPQYRGKGIGTKLMKEMLTFLNEKGYKKASLSVQKDNYAASMYQQVGFEISEEKEQEYIMICNFN